MIKEAIAKTTRKENLSFSQAREAFEEIFNHQATAAQIAAFLVSLTIKGESEEEIAAAADVVRAKALRLQIRDAFLGIEDREEPVMDTCGTGGSGINKFNISTATAFVVASAGIKVAKHGNRAMSSNCGSADVLMELGVKIDVPPSAMEEAIKKTGVGFLYAPLYHPALKSVAQIRREIGIKTIFNILGPLCNPAHATHQLLGVYRRPLVPVVAAVLKNLGVKKALVVHSDDLKDEVSLTGKTHAAYLNKKTIKNLTLSNASFGLKKIKIKDIEVTGAKESARLIKNIFDAKRGACRDITLANASTCFYILGKVKNLKDGVRMASQLIDEGKVKKKFDEFKEFIESHK